MACLRKLSRLAEAVHAPTRTQHEKIANRTATSPRIDRRVRRCSGLFRITNHQSPITASSGFTLLELLVAVALFAVVAVLAYGGLDQIARQGGDLEAESARLADVQRAVDRLVSDLRAATPRPIRDASTGRVPALLGAAQSIEFTRGGYGNRLAQPRAELERVGYRLEGNQLLRLHFAALDRPSSLPERNDQLLDGVVELRLSYRDTGGRELAGWPDARSSNASLPAAVMLRLRLDDYGDIERLIELPQGDTPP